MASLRRSRISMLLFAAAVTAVLGGGARAATLSITSATTSTGLVAAYAFDEGSGTTVADSSGNGNTGTISGATWTSAGKNGSALSFNGASSWVTVPDSSSLDLTGGMTLEAWIKPASLSGWRVVAEKEQTGELVYSLYANSDQNTPVNDIYVGGAEHAIYGTAQPALNTWTHLAATYDGTALRLYVNGTLVSSAALSGQMPVSNGALRIGGDSVWGEYFNGLIDDVRVYNRALSQTEIQSDMSTPVGGSGGGGTVAAPANTSAPTVSGNPVVGDTLTASNGSWTNSPTSYGYQWQRCDSTGTCANIAGANANSYSPSSTDVGSMVDVVVSASNAGGSGSASSGKVGPVNAALVAAYSFDEGSGTTVGDASNSGNNGTISNATWTSAGKFGGALSFNGSNSWVTVNDSNSLDLSNRMTLEAWVNPASLNAWRVVIQKEQTGELVYGLYANSDRNTPVSDIYTNGAEHILYDTNQLPLNTWTFLAETYDGSTLTLYINGAQVGTLPVSGNMPSSTGPLRIGGDSVWGEYFNGLIDNVRIYKRALTASQIQADMSTPVGGGTPPPADTTPPSAPGNLTVTGATASSISLSWSASTDNVGVSGYNVYSNGTKVATTTGTSYTVSGLTCGTTYTLGVEAFDAAGNVSTRSTVSGSTSACSTADTTPPSPPGNLTVTGSTQTSISVSWSASTDNVGVSGYNVYSNGTKVATTTSTSATVSALTCGTTYTIGVEAFDAAGNVSTRSTVSGATSACSTADTTPPSPPGNLTVTGSTQTSISLSWSASTDNVGVTGYNVYSNGTKVATTTNTTATVGGLTCGTTYTLGVEAFDAAGNVSTRSTVSGSTSACPPPPPSGPCGYLSTPPAKFSHVIWIWMENHAYGQIIGSSAAPYENQLANQCGLATNYTAITHPSLPNYIAATSGSTWGISDDNGPSSHPVSAPSIFSQVASKSYEESMPFSCDQGDSYPYAVKHNPEAYYTSLGNCGSTDVPMGSTSSGNFLSDLNNNTLPAFSFVTPNLCNDMHDCSVQTGDSWLSSWVPKIIASPAYQQGGTAIFITFDEDDGSSGNQVATIVVSPYTAAGTRSGTAFNHYSLLRTTEQMLGVNTYLQNAAGASSMYSAFFGPPPPPPPLPSGPLVPASGALFGAWVNDPNTGWTQQGVLNFESMIGRKLKVDMHYDNFQTAIPTAGEVWDAQNGRIPLITWEPWGTTLDAINAGSFDQYFHDSAVALKNLGQPVFLRPMHEMNGNWYPWGGPNNNSSTTSTDGPSKYIQAWKRIHDIFAAVGASNVVWVWSPNWESVPKDAYNAYSNYYPGDNYVDWVGIDGYNWGTTQTWSSWMNYSTIESAIYGSYSATKPIMTAETASCEQGGSKAQWISDTQTAAKTQFPDIRAFIWFNENKECDWRVNSSTTALSAYQAMGADPYFNP